MHFSDVLDICFPTPVFTKNLIIYFWRDAHAHSLAVLPTTTVRGAPTIVASGKLYSNIGSADVDYRKNPL